MTLIRNLKFLIARCSNLIDFLTLKISIFSWNIMFPQNSRKVPIRQIAQPAQAPIKFDCSILLVEPSLYSLLITSSARRRSFRIRLMFWVRTVSFLCVYFTTPPCTGLQTAFSWASVASSGAPLQLRQTWEEETGCVCKLYDCVDYNNTLG